MTVFELAGAATNGKWLLDPKPGNRPLASLAIRTRLACCLRLIDDETRRVVDSLRSLRNKHAHGTSAFKLTKSHTQSIVNALSEGGREVLDVLIKEGSFGEMSEARKELMVAVSMVALRIESTIKNLQKDGVGIESIEGHEREDE